MSFIRTFLKVYALGKEMHPNFTFNHVKHQIKLMFVVVSFFSEIQKWYETSNNPLLERARSRFPLMSGAIYWPYINHTWSMKRKLATIDQHFRMLEGSASIIAQATFVEVELARIDEEFAGLRLVLDKAKWFLREGEIVLNLFLGDHRCYSIAFTLGVDCDKQPMIYVGALQGSNDEFAKEVYRNLTHVLHGMRPRDFLMAALKLLCLEMGIKKIWAISSESRQNNSSYFGKAQDNKVVNVIYNLVWTEHGGVALGNGFYDIPILIKYRDVTEIPTRKRATYRRRYLMLDKLALDIKKCCSYRVLY